MLIGSKGFPMTVGSPSTNTLTSARTHPGLRYTCLQSALTRGAETPDFPSKPCAAGIMAIHHFPACWDGKNLDSPDHQSHMYVFTGAAPMMPRIRIFLKALPTDAVVFPLI